MYNYAHFVISCRRNVCVVLWFEFFTRRRKEKLTIVGKLVEKVRFFLLVVNTIHHVFLITCFISLDIDKSEETTVQKITVV